MLPYWHALRKYANFLCFILKKRSIATLQTRIPQPSAYIRALVQSLLVQDSQVLSSIDPGQFCCDDIAQLVLPRSPLIDPENDTVEFPSDPRYQIAKYMREFVQRASQVCCYYLAHSTVSVLMTISLLLTFSERCA